MNHYTRYTLFLSSIFIVFSSCIGSRQRTLLQDQQPDVVNTLATNAKTYTLKPTEYRLKPDDKISIRVFSLTQEKFNFLGSPEFEVTVNSRGEIELPVVGYIQVSQNTLPEVEEKIKALTLEYLKSPSVTVKLVNFTFTVLGEVGSQGNFTAANSRMNILEAIGQAGGLTDFANRSRIRVLRHGATTAQVYEIDLLEDNLLLTENYYLQPNDVIMVDPVSARYTQERTNNFFRSFSIFSTISSLVLTWVFISRRF
jgi:polysaccharide biosynthesis/export protein